MSQNTVIGALGLVKKTFKLLLTVAKQLVPTRGTLQNAAVEMMVLADMMIAEHVLQAECRTLAFGGSNNCLKDLQSIQAHTKAAMAAARVPQQ